MPNHPVPVVDIVLTGEELKVLGYEPQGKLTDKTKFRLQSDGSWRAFEGSNSGLIIQRPLILGTLGGRHSKMDADHYLAGKVIPGQSAFDTVYAQAIKLARAYPGAFIHLIYSGLTECTIAAVLALIAANAEFHILRFDSRAKGYVPLDISQFYTDLGQSPV